VKKSRFSIDQTICILAEAPGDSGAATARKYGVAEQTIYNRWRQKYKGFSAFKAKLLKLYFDTF